MCLHRLHWPGTLTNLSLTNLFPTNLSPTKQSPAKTMRGWRMSTLTLQ
jgi:hypothetical protein